jgi:hypothetical protein
MGCRLEDAAESDMGRVSENEQAARICGYRERERRRVNAYCRCTGRFSVGGPGDDRWTYHIVNVTETVDGVEG